MLGMPVADDRARLDERGGAAEFDQDDDDGDHGHRRGRLHGDAQRAVVGIRLRGMHMRHLNHDQQRHQRQTQQNSGSKRARPAASAFAQICLEAGQQDHPLLKGYTELDASARPGLRLLPDFRLFRSANSRPGRLNC